MEISQASISQCTVEVKTKLTDDLFRLLQVRQKNQDMSKDWLLFINDTPKFSRLTPGEIYLAFKMAQAQEIVDSKGEGFNLLPELSINATGKVLSAYVEWKRLNSNYHIAKEKLCSLNAPSGPTPEQRRKIRVDFLFAIFSDLQKNRFSDSCWILYDELKERLSISIEVKKRLYKRQLDKYTRELESDVKSKGKKQHHVQLLEQVQKNIKDGKSNPIVSNRCKSIVVSNYLRKFSQFEEFIKELSHGLE